MPKKPEDLIKEVQEIIEKYSKVFGIKNFSEAVEYTLRKFVIYVRKNEEEIRRRLKEVEY